MGGADPAPWAWCLPHPEGYTGCTWTLSTIDYTELSDSGYSVLLVLSLRLRSYSPTRELLLSESIYQSIINNYIKKKWLTDWRPFFILPINYLHVLWVPFCLLLFSSLGGGRVCKSGNNWNKQILCRIFNSIVATSFNLLLHQNIFFGKRKKPYESWRVN